MKKKVRKLPRQLALERIADSLEKIATYMVLLEAGMKQSYQKPINVYMQLEEEDE